MGEMDELDCAPCSAEQFTCGSRECISNKQKCDKNVDCLDGSDEETCGKSGQNMYPISHRKNVKLLYTSPNMNS